MPRDRSRRPRFLRRYPAAEEILVLGDSHAAAFRHPRFVWCFPRHYFRVCAVGGATASGLENPHSQSQAAARFAAALRQGIDGTLIVMLGEVDTGFVIWYRAQKHDEPVAAMFDQAVERYTRFIAELAARCERLIVVSTPLPTIADGQELGEIAKLRREVRATQRERTDLTRRFNGAVGAFCAGAGVHHLDLDPDSLGPDGLVRPELLRSDPSDHHYHPGRYAALLCRRLRPLIRGDRRCTARLPPPYAPGW